MPSDKKSLTNAQVLEKMRAYCVYQDRCHSEVRSKLFDYGLGEQEKEEIICRLIEDDFLNEERFARSFVRGKSKIKLWGRDRIVRELLFRGIPKMLINTALSEIEREDEDKNFEILATRKANQIERPWSQAKKGRLYNYLRTKGYSADMIFGWMEKNIG